MTPEGIVHVPEGACHCDPPTKRLEAVTEWGSWMTPDEGSVWQCEHGKRWTAVKLGWMIWRAEHPYDRSVRLRRESRAARRAARKARR